MNTLEQAHTDMVNDLAKDGQKIISQLTPTTADMLHMAVGISGEAVEILEAAILWQEIADGMHHKGEWKQGQSAGNYANMIEELGDAEFYLNKLYSIMGVERHLSDDVLSGKDIVKLANKLVIQTGGVLDQVKKIVIYNKPPANCIVELSRFLIETEIYLNLIRQYTSITREQTLEANIYKLTKSDNARYKGGVYTDKAAVERADKKEDQ